MASQGLFARVAAALFPEPTEALRQERIAYPPRELMRPRAARPAQSFDFLPTYMGDQDPSVAAHDAALPQPPAAVQAFAPLTERVPPLVNQAVLDAFEAAAQKLEATGAEVMRSATECQAKALDAAARMRALGQQQAAAVEQATIMVRDTARRLDDELAKLAGFRSGVDLPTAATAAPSDAPAS